MVFSLKGIQTFRGADAAVIHAIDRDPDFLAKPLLAQPVERAVFEAHVWLDMARVVTGRPAQSPPDPHE